MNKSQIANFVFNYHDHSLPNIFRRYFLSITKSIIIIVEQLLKCIKLDLNFFFTENRSARGPKWPDTILITVINVQYLHQ